MPHDDNLMVLSRTELIENTQGLVRSIALGIHRRLPSGFDADDLIGFGQVGLMEAVEDFRPDAGVLFSTFAWYRIRGAILDGVSHMSWFGRHGRRSVQYTAAADDVLEQEVTESPVAESQKFGSTVRALGVAYLLSLQSDQAPEPAGGGETPEESLKMSELRTRVSQAIGQLPDAERQLVRGVYFEGLSISDAGRKLQVGRAWSSRVHARALEQLGKILRNSDAES